MDQFEQTVRQLLAEQPEHELTTTPEPEYSVGDLEAVLLRWSDRHLTAIKGRLLARFLTFLEHVKNQLPVPIKGQLFPQTPDDEFVRNQGWVTKEGPPGRDEEEEVEEEPYERF
jgi:hypothetical protein